MKKLDFLLIHSVLKELNRVTSAEHVEIDLSEEETSLPEIINIGEESRITEIETYSLIKDKKVFPEEIWAEDLFIDIDKDYKHKINLRYFLDGIQQTCWIKNIPIMKTGEKVPYHAGQVGAVILERENRKLSVIKKLTETRFNIIMPVSFIKDVTDFDKVKSFITNRINQLPGFKIQDSSFYPNPKTESGKVVYTEDGEEIHERISNLELKKKLTEINYFRKLHMKWNVRNRVTLEHKIYNNFPVYLKKQSKKEDNADFIIVDGTLTDVRREAFLLNAIGIIKSHRMRFLDIKKHNKAYQLKAFRRTPAFLIGKPIDESSIESGSGFNKKNYIKVSPRVSWYLRIRKMEHFIPTWGLLRIEVHPKLLPHEGSADLWNKEDSLLINSISQKIIEDRFPTSHPDKRWANLLYPIFKCEQYLKSLIIPRNIIKYIATTPQIKEV